MGIWAHIPHDLPHDDQQDRSDDRTGQCPQTAHNRHRKNQAHLDQQKILRCEHLYKQVTVDRTGKAGKETGDHKRVDFPLDEFDPHGRRDVFIFTDGLQIKTFFRVDDQIEHADCDDRQQQHHKISQQMIGQSIAEEIRNLQP